MAPLQSLNRFTRSRSRELAFWFELDNEEPRSTEPVVSLREITRENWAKAIALDVKPEQHVFVPSVAVCLAKAYIRPENAPVVPFGIYSSNKMVGFFTITHDAQTTEQFWINGFQIDRKFQRQGYGRAALAEIAVLLQKMYPRIRRIRLTLEPHNEVARRLYESFGFMNTGKIYEGEIVYRLELSEKK